jgi:hypothetical protein
MLGAKHEVAIYGVVWVRGEDEHGSTPVAERIIATAQSTPPFMQMVRARSG